MKFAELPIETQEQLKKDMTELKNKSYQDSHNIVFYNNNGTRYFTAVRVHSSWNDNKGNYLPYGGGSEWKIAYGAIRFKSYRNPMGQIDYELAKDKSYQKSDNGTIIERTLKTKKEVLALVAKIGKFDEYLNK